MKIETNGYQITGVSGLEMITVGREARGVIVTLYDGHETPRAFGLDELEDYSNAIIQALRFGHALAHEAEVNANTAATRG